MTLIHPQVKINKHSFNVTFVPPRIEISNHGPIPGGKLVYL